MRRLVKTLHMYAGLFSFTAFIVYGISGLYATVPIGRRADPAGTREVRFAAPGNVGDKELADHVYRTLDLPLTGPVPAWALRRNEAGHLRLDFYTANGVRRVTVLEDEGLVRVEMERTRMLAFLDNLHTSVLAYVAPRALTLAWAIYNEIAIWALVFMSISGVYLWLASRPSHRAAQLALAAGTGAFAALYWVTR